MNTKDKKCTLSNKFEHLQKYKKENCARLSTELSLALQDLLYTIDNALFLAILPFPTTVNNSAHEIQYYNV